MSTTIEHDGFSITSNTETEAAMRSALGAETLPVEQTDAPDDHGEVAGSGAAEGNSGKPEASADDPAGLSTADAPKDKKAKPRENMHARLSQETARRHALEQRTAELEAELTRYKQTPAPREEPKQPPAPVSDKPSWKTFEAQIGTQYESWADAQDAYIDARDEWKETQQREKQAQEQRQAAGKSHYDRVQTFRKTHPDFDTVVNAVSDIPASAVLQEAILALPNSADVVYWLASNRDEFSQLASETASLDVIAAPLVKRLLQARLGAGEPSGSVPAVELSTAKPPVRPVGVSSVVVPDEPGEDEPFDAYFARMNASDRKKGR